MIIDAMDILYSKNVDGFCLVSSDSDFTRLAARLREAGMQVIGMGESKTPPPFISACNQFKYLDKLYEKNIQESVSVAPTESSGDDGSDSIDKVKKTIRNIIENFSDDEGWIFSAKLGDQLSKRLPDFDVRNYGYSKLTLFMNSLGDYEINKLSLGNHKKQIYFRIKQDVQADEKNAAKKSEKSSKKRSRRSSRRAGGRK